MNHRGWAYLFSDAFTLALADFDAALRIDANLGHAYGGRGLARVSLGTWRDALTDADTAVRLATAAQKQRTCLNAARVYALAIKFAADQVSRRGEAALAQRRRLRQRAAALLASRYVSSRPTSSLASGVRWSRPTRRYGPSWSAAGNEPSFGGN